MVMNENTKWIAVILQEYTAPKGGRTGSGTPNGMPGIYTAQVAQLRFHAASAQAAMDRAELWLIDSGIECAYVDCVCLDGMVDIDLDEGANNGND